MGLLKVLIAEDNKSVQALYNLGLSDERYQKKFASNGEEALGLYGSWAPDVIILDIMMPVMTGYNVLKNIREREQESGKSTTVIMSTAMSDKSDIMDCARLGIEGYIIKPFKHKELAAKVESYHAGKQEKKGG
ncbi:MAG: response regulator [Nitrospinae bacterium]|nr:response regulator [Nitrospinota bacterium]